MQRSCAYRLALTSAMLVIVPQLLCAQPKPYQPARRVSGTIRNWGSEQMRDLVRRWEVGFRRFHPDVKFEDHLNGVVSAMGGLYGGAADLAFMGREIWPMEELAYKQATGHDPSGIEVATGSFDVPTKADALVIFVHRTNPLSRITFAQLDAIFGAGHPTKDARTWGDLGLREPLASHAIHPYGPRIDNAAAMFFARTVMGGSRKWNPDYVEFANRDDGAGRRTDAGKLILDALASDPGGIAISNPSYAGTDVKPLAIAERDNSIAVAANRDTVKLRTYPLSRSVFIFFNRAETGTTSPIVEEFLHYVLSDEGQREVLAEGAYLPLPPARIDRALQSLR